MTAQSEPCRNHTVEKMVNGGIWVPTTFENLKDGEVIRFFDQQSKTVLEQNGATVFMVVDEARQAGGQSNVNISVVPFTPDTGLNALSECPYYGNIVVRDYGMDKLIEATGYCTECRHMRVCLQARYSSAYFEQLRGALSLDDIDN